MLIRKWIAIGLCIAFVLGAYLTWNLAFGGFNPNPVTTSITQTGQSCSISGGCGVFRIDSANLSVRANEDIVSQILNLQLSDVGSTPMSYAKIFLGTDQGNFSIGQVNGPFAPGESRPVSLGIPTTITLSQGASYTVLVEGFFGSQGSSGYFQSVEVVAQ